MMRTKAPFLILLLLVVFQDLRASDPASNRGIDLSGAFHVADFDVVNLYNGNLMIDLPLAAQFPLNGGFSYGIHLVYTGQPWDFPMEERPGALPEDPNQVKAVPIPNRRSNAGIGWRVSMGRLILSSDATALCDDYQPEDCRATLYESPDGADHRFSGNSAGYSEDGSYLRLSTHTNTSPNYEEIEFPDGSIHRFDTQGRLIAIYTPFDRTASTTPIASVTVDYLTNDTANQCHDTAAKSCWKVHDNLGRTQYVTFYDTNNLYPTQLARSIIVTAAGSDVTYTLNYYQQADGKHVDSADFDLHLDTCYDRWRQVTDANTTRVPILSSVDLPDGSRYEIGTEHNAVGSVGGCFEGSLLKLTLPTRGTIEYGYFDWLQGHERNYDPPYLPGVSRRTKTAASGSPAEVWTYVPEKGAADMTGCCADHPPQYRDRMVTITDPDHRVSRHYFNNAPYPISEASIAAGWTPAEAGLPFTRRTGTRTPDPTKTNPMAADDFFLSNEILDATGTVERSTYVQYDYDAFPGETTPARFRRERASLFQYSDGKWSLTARSDFDHFGHYRNTEMYGNFATESSDQDRRTEYVNYNPDRGTWGATGWTDWPASAPWVLNTFDQEWGKVPKTNTNDSTEAAWHTKKQEFCFDPNTGFLNRRRLLQNDAATAEAIAQNGADLVTEFGRTNHNGTADTTGNVISEKSYGGDTPYGTTTITIPSGSLCDLPLPSPRYQLWHSYQNGVPATSEYYSSGGSMGFKTLDRTTHLSGAVSSERDMAGVTTNYTYDPANPLRINSIARSGAATINYTYANASSTLSFTPAQITVTQSDVTSRVQYDSFGRVWREFRTMPGVGEVTRETLYDASNRKLSESVWAAGSYANKTTYHYDFLGRLDTVNPSDHQTVATSYSGDSSRTTTTKVFLATDPSSAQTDVSTIERMDRYGRLWYVQEPNATVTAYGYGVTGALSRVCMKASLSAGVLSTAACGQERLFAYDNRGFLTSETHPENGTTAYTYDAGGHVLTKRPSTTGTQFDLNYFYDGAERLKKVDSRNSSSFHVSKEYTYGTANTTTNVGLGKPATAVRHNYQTNGDDYQVTETYAYNDQAGRLTDRETEVFKPDNSQLQKFSQSQSYTLLGQPNALTYPSCEGSVACGSSSQTGVSNAYTNGLLSSVTNFGSLTYHPSGMVKTVSHDNGVVDTYDVDSTTGIPRPKSITFGTFASCTQPSITAQPSSPTIAPGNSATLSVTGTPALVTFQWHDANGTLLSGQTSSIFTTPALNADHSYFVRVSNSCGLVNSLTATVHVSAGNAPVIIAHPQSTTAVPAHLTVTATGTAPLTYHWYQGTAGNTTTTVGANSASFDTPNITVTTKYWVRVSNAAGSADSNVATVTVPLGTPGSLTATWQGANPIQVAWTAVAGTNLHYELWRRDHGGAFASYGTSATASFNDASVSPNATYVYKVRALDANNESASSFSNVDLATTMTFIPTGDARILRDHVTELLTALNAMQTAAGWPQLTWGGILRGSPPPPAPALNVLVYAEHILALRRNMDLVYAQLLGTPLPYTDPTLADPNLPGSPKVRIKWVHITELRSRVQ
jgi:YD repeat-containing protein